MRGAPQRRMSSLPGPMPVRHVQHPSAANRRRKQIAPTPGDEPVTATNPGWVPVGDLVDRAFATTNPCYHRPRTPGCPLCCRAWCSGPQCWVANLFPALERRDVVGCWMTGSGD